MCVCGICSEWGSPSLNPPVCDCDWKRLFMSAVDSYNNFISIISLVDGEFDCWNFGNVNYSGHKRFNPLDVYCLWRTLLEPKRFLVDFRQRFRHSMSFSLMNVPHSNYNKGVAWWCCEGAQNHGNCHLRHRQPNVMFRSVHGGDNKIKLKCCFILIKKIN